MLPGEGKDNQDRERKNDLRLKIRQMRVDAGNTGTQVQEKERGRERKKGTQSLQNADARRLKFLLETTFGEKELDVVASAYRGKPENDVGEGRAACQMDEEGFDGRGIR